jgi:hypothetical protein
MAAENEADELNSPDTFLEPIVILLPNEVPNENLLATEEKQDNVLDLFFDGAKLLQGTNKQVK